MPDKLQERDLGLTHFGGSNGDYVAREIVWMGI